MCQHCDQFEPAVITTTQGGRARRLRRQILMRFCMVTTYYPPYHFGGDATYVRALSRALVSQGHEVEIVHCVDAYRLKNRNRVPEEAADPGIVVHRLKSRIGFFSPLITQLTGHPGLDAGFSLMQRNSRQ